MKYKVGDKVKIVSEKTGDGWNSHGEMDKWLGKVMTIREITEDDCYLMEEDDCEGIFANGWYWSEYMVECKVNDPKYIVEDL